MMRVLLVLLVVLFASAAYANTGWSGRGWGYEPIIDSVTALCIWIGLTILVETTVLYLARPVRETGPRLAKSLKRLSWNGVLGVVVVINLASAVVGTLAAFLSPFLIDSNTSTEGAILLVALFHFVGSVVVEMMVASLLVVFTSKVFLAIFAGNMISYSIMLLLILHHNGFMI
jgi:hypothetical protein